MASYADKIPWAVRRYPMVFPHPAGEYGTLYVSPNGDNRAYLKTDGTVAVCRDAIASYPVGYQVGGQYFLGIGVFVYDPANPLYGLAPPQSPDNYLYYWVGSMGSNYDNKELKDIPSKVTFSYKIEGKTYPNYGYGSGMRWKDSPAYPPPHTPPYTFIPPVPQVVTYDSTITFTTDSDAWTPINGTDRPYGGKAYFAVELPRWHPLGGTQYPPQTEVMVDYTFTLTSVTAPFSV